MKLTKNNLKQLIREVLEENPSSLAGGASALSEEIGAWIQKIEEEQLGVSGRENWPPIVKEAGKILDKLHSRHNNWAENPSGHGLEDLLKELTFEFKQIQTRAGLKHDPRTDTEERAKTRKDLGSKHTTDLDKLFQDS